MPNVEVETYIAAQRHVHQARTEGSEAVSARSRQETRSPQPCLRPCQAALLQRREPRVRRDAIHFPVTNGSCVVYNNNMGASELLQKHSLELLPFFSNSFPTWHTQTAREGKRNVTNERRGGDHTPQNDNVRWDGMAPISLTKKPARPDDPHNRIHTEYSKCLTNLNIQPFPTYLPT